MFRFHPSNRRTSCSRSCLSAICLKPCKSLQIFSCALTKLLRYLLRKLFSKPWLVEPLDTNNSSISLNSSRARICALSNWPLISLSSTAAGWPTQRAVEVAPGTLVSFVLRFSAKVELLIEQSCRTCLAFQRAPHTTSPTVPSLRETHYQTLQPTSW